MGCLLQSTIRWTGMKREAFVHPRDLQERLNQEGIANYVYRIVEELGALTDETKEEYPDMAWTQIRGLRNILAHAYGDVQPAMVWQIIEEDIPAVLVFCQAWADDHDIELPVSEL